MAEIMANKQGKRYGDVVTWIQHKISIGLCKAVGVCLRGSRNVFGQGKLNVDEDISISLITTSINA